MSETNTMPEQTDTIEDLKALIREAEEALSGTTDRASEEIEALRERLRDVLEDGKTSLRSITDSLRKQAGRADEVIRANPYQTLGIATGVGLLAGFLIARSCNGR